MQSPSMCPFDVSKLSLEAVLFVMFMIKKPYGFQVSRIAYYGFQVSRIAYYQKKIIIVKNSDVANLYIFLVTLGAPLHYISERCVSVMSTYPGASAALGTIIYILDFLVSNNFLCMAYLPYFLQYSPIKTQDLIQQQDDWERG
ncbi:hypothetical protein NC651_007348 [Populus alba x Populus x berolinensis]|nr:hypothetical protein NC651_007348 [Populus alba x Populus x berolinensis]